MCMAYLCCCQDAEEEGGLRLKHPAGLAVAGTCSTRAAELWYNNPLERDQDQQLHPENGCWSCRKPDCMILALCIAVFTPDFLISLTNLGCCVAGSTLSKQEQACLNLYGFWRYHCISSCSAWQYCSHLKVLLFLLQILLNYFHPQVNGVSTLLFLVILMCSLQMCWNSQSNAKLMGLFGIPPAHEKVNIKGK